MSQSKAQNQFNEGMEVQLNEVDLEVQASPNPNEEENESVDVDDDNLSNVWSARSNAVANGGYFKGNNRKLCGAAAATVLLLTIVASVSSKVAKNRVVMSQQKSTAMGASKSAKSPSAKAPKSPSSKAGKVSCVSGDAGVSKVREDGTVTIIAVKDAEPGDVVKGLDDNRSDADCNVIALGYWGKGALYGNYTASHYVYDDSSGNIVEHGEIGDYSFGDKFALLSTCPLIVDEAGIAFTPLDSDVNYFGAAQENGILMWTDYVNEFNGFSVLVSAVGPCIMDQDGYDDIQGFKAFSVVFNEAVKKCVDNGGDDCIAAIDSWEDMMKFYAEPCKSEYLTAITPLLDLRDAGSADVIRDILDPAAALN
mmetsp:Transcript_22332/g.34304  ORF Transcript_22332/g.34304 Transcript_22332/m.34304 type:complete len:366 (-) Transcript_22332:178-1275(-)